MKRIIFLTAFIIYAHAVFSQTKNFIDQPYVETISNVDTLVTPDRIFLSILIAESDTKGKQTVEELEQLMADKLTEIGIDLENQLALSDLSSNFKKYFLRKQDILKAQSYELKVFDARTAGRIIYEIEGIGISNVELERMEYSKIEELKLDLKSKAIKKAKRQAEAMLQPLNQEIGNAIFISDIKTDIVNPLRGRVSGISIRGYASDKEESKALLIEFEKIKVESEVAVKFSILVK